MKITPEQNKRIKPKQQQQQPTKKTPPKTPNKQKNQAPTSPAKTKLSR